MSLFFGPKQHNNAKHADAPNFVRFKLALAVVSLLVAFFISTVFDALKYRSEETLGGFFWTLLSDSTPEERITIVAIDEESLSQVGPWPWPRETMAKLSDQLAAYGASMQLFDVVFPEEKPGDALFANRLSNNNAVIAQVPVLDNGYSVRSGVLSGALDKARCQLPIPATQNYLANAAPYKAIPKGHITPIIDADGQIRKQPPLICIDGEVYPSLALQSLLHSLQQGSDKSVANVAIEAGSGLLSSEWKLSIGTYFGLNIPLDHQGNMRISYKQAPEAFQVVSAAKVLDGTAPKALLEGSWALIGATAFGLGDVVPTPYNGIAPGVELQARLISSLIDGAVPYTPAISKYILILEGLLATLVLFALGYRSHRSSAYSLPIATILLPLSVISVHAYLMSFDVWIGWFNVAVYSLTLGLLFTLFEHAVIRDERHRILGHLSSYLPKTVAQRLMRSVPTGAIEAYRSDLVVMSADLRNFSAYEESRSPEEAAALLHCFFVKATEIVESHGGQIEEYTGDAVLSSWSTQSSNQATSQAVDAANELQRAMQEILPTRAPKGLEPLALGIGIERGPTLIGSIGPAHRRTHTLLGDTVTIALRIQEMTQDLAQPVLVGECAARDLSGNVLVSQGSFLLDGLRTPHVLFALNTSFIENEQSTREHPNTIRIVKTG
ncbi:CHASE2 domain-containing protein [Marinomonas ostreistagni]|uniref:Adenylate/guanylate cyclase domain-containing protein n=1 Tax=Marinomonas ostreistagni TaxID=359209 RepID=A0ABS0ZCU8_9GAMM|nr:adenylate/guanylate cyclase domain-containing protein [Marinomonas ostreistagni]MBJ7551491.1 adenylate/guanylate cyclase domain-containing protein [Marinomonas ostreistagni]